MSKISLMRDKDIDIVNENVDDIIERAHNKEISLLKPTLEEFNKIKNIILDFIKSKKRIIYGGYAWNTLVSNINPKDAFYKENHFTDVEFYSNKPIDDMKELCDILFDKGFSFIQGKSAQHSETYTIFVEFTPCCDISYMPTHIFNTMMTETINGLKLVHPRFIYVDILRQFNDPILSFRRLDKNIKRGKILIQNFPLIFNQKSIDQVKSKLKSNKRISGATINENLLSDLLKMKSLIFIGNIAFNAYINPNVNIKKQTTIYDGMTPIEVISTNLVIDTKNIHNNIIKYFLDHNQSEQMSEKIVIEQYYPFFQFTDKKVIFKYENQPFLIIYGNNEKCIPFNEISITIDKSLSPINIGTFNMLFMFSLIKYHISFTTKDKNEQQLQDYYLYSLLMSKNKFLNDNNKTVLDETIFEDFKINCIGITESPMRKYYKSMRDRTLLSRSSITPYDPESKRDNYPTDSYYFNNTSGNIINNDKDLIIRISN